MEKIAMLGGTPVKTTPFGTGKRFGEEELNRINDIQKSVLRSAAKMLKPGGRLVYSTCSILKRENQDVIEEFRKRMKISSCLMLLIFFRSRE